MCVRGSSIIPVESNTHRKEFILLAGMRSVLWRDSKSRVSSRFCSTPLDAITPNPLQDGKGVVYPSVYIPEKMEENTKYQQHKHIIASKVLPPEPLQSALVPLPGLSRDIRTRLHPVGHRGPLGVVVAAVLPAGGVDRGEP